VRGPFPSPLLSSTSRSRCSNASGGGVKLSADTGCSPPIAPASISRPCEGASSASQGGLSVSCQGAVSIERASGTAPILWRRTLQGRRWGARPSCGVGTFELRGECSGRARAIGARERSTLFPGRWSARNPPASDLWAIAGGLLHPLGRSFETSAAAGSVNRPPGPIVLWDLTVPPDRSTPFLPLITRCRPRPAVVAAARGPRISPSTFPCRRTLRSRANGRRSRGRRAFTVPWCRCDEPFRGA